MNKDKYYYEILNKYREALTLYESLFDNFSYIVKEISEIEKVYIIEDSFIAYVGIRDFRCDGSTEARAFKVEQNHYNFKRDITRPFLLVFEELTYNSLFKVNASKLIRSIGGDPSFCIYKFFDGGYGNPIKSLNFAEEEKQYDEDFAYKSNYTLVTTMFPEIMLKQRIDEWKGKPYSFIIYKIEYDNFVGYAVNSTTTGLTTDFILVTIREIEKSIRFGYGGHSTSGPIIKVHSGFQHVCWNTPAFKKAMMLLLKRYYEDNNINPNKSKVLYPKFVPNGVLKYWVYEDFYKGRNLIPKYQEILNNVEYYISQSGMFTEYSILENKWKSEELVYKNAKSLFAKNEVIWQYRPYFLKSKHGQLSYDVFVCGENIAIEYQGKQHFEPIEYFGGEEHFNKQVERDKLKKKLSDENGITLIYINYDENISVELIKQKLLSEDRFKNSKKYYLK